MHFTYYNKLRNSAWSMGGFDSQNDAPLGSLCQSVKCISHTITTLGGPMAGSAPVTIRVELAGIPLEVSERGRGHPLLFLHPGHPAGRLDPSARIMELLAENARVIAPTHPGFGMTQAPPKLTTIAALAYL